MNGFKSTFSSLIYHDVPKMVHTKQTLDNILIKVCEYMNVKLNDIKSASRKREIVNARKMFSRIAYFDYDFTCYSIGEILNREHESITYYINCDTDDKEYNEIKESLNA